MDVYLKGKQLKLDLIKHDEIKPLKTEGNYLPIVEQVNTKSSIKVPKG